MKTYDINTYSTYSMNKLICPNNSKKEKLKSLFLLL